jgi:membrane protease YdiL (CAAX protease family)
VNQLASFLRSVLPADLTQLLLLVGSVLLLVCMEMRCYPRNPDYVPGVNVFISGTQANDPQAAEHRSWLVFSIVARFPIVLAGAAGLFVCFWPGRRPLRRLLVFVGLPAVIGIAALCGRFLYLSRVMDRGHTSVLQSPHNEAWAISAVWGLGPALHMSMVGAFLIMFFASRLAFGLTSLPLALPFESGQSAESSGWNRLLAFIWLSIVGVLAVGGLFFLLVRAVYDLVHRLFLISIGSVLPPFYISGWLAIAGLAGFAAWAVGGDRWKELRRFVRLPRAQFGLLGAAFPIAVHQIPSLLAYLRDRVAWATTQFGKMSPPFFPSYFELPAPYLLWNVLSVVFEEIIWRGYLQPRFVLRFGLFRGIFLLGLSWSAFHFLGDFQGVAQDQEVLMRLVSRLGLCVAMSYVLGWLVLRSGSIWPGVLVHGLHNVWAFSGFHPFLGKNSAILRTVIWLTWAALAFVLFRYWPLQDTEYAGETGATVEAEPTV